MTGRRLDVLAVVDRVDFGGLPGRFRMPMRGYLGQGALPEGALRAVLEGDAQAVLSFREDLEGYAALVGWISHELPAACHGSKAQVGLWCVYVRRARGRAMLAAMSDDAA